MLYIYIYICIHIQTCIYIFMIHSDALTLHIHTYTHTHTYPYTHTHARYLALNSDPNSCEKLNISRILFLLRRSNAEYPPRFVLSENLIAMISPAPYTLSSTVVDATRDTIRILEGPKSPSTGPVYHVCMKIHLY